MVRLMDRLGILVLHLPPVCSQLLRGLVLELELSRLQFSLFVADLRREISRYHKIEQSLALGMVLRYLRCASTFKTLFRSGSPALGTLSGVLCFLILPAGMSLSF